MLATPVDFDGRPPSPAGARRGLGEHTRQVLAESGSGRQPRWRHWWPTVSPCSTGREPAAGAPAWSAARAGTLLGLRPRWPDHVRPDHVTEDSAMDETVRQHKFVLEESEMPTTWYNIVPDLPSPPPPALHPGTLEPAGPDDFAPLFPMDLILQEVSPERYIEIPGAVLDVYRQWRPSPLYRAHRLEQALDTPARIYYKYEGVSPAGSHKPNTAVPQAYYNAKAGVRKLTTETGAGQWGSALAFACALFGLECEVWQVGASYDQKPYRRLMMETFGATVHRSPSPIDRGRAPVPGRGPAPPGLARDRHLRGRGGGGAEPRDPLRAGQRAQPRAAPPDGHRGGGAAPAGQGRRDRARRDRRLHRGRLELRRALVPVPAREAGREDVPRHPRRRARLVPVAHPRGLRLRLRRHRRHDAR